MIETVLFFAHHSLNLLWGVVLSAAFSGLRFSKKNLGIIGIIFAACGISQMLAFLLFGEQTVWELYPLIVHGLLTVLLISLFHKRFITVLAAVTVAYLCCQPSKWFGLLAAAFIQNDSVVWCVKIVVALGVFLGCVLYFAGHISEIFNKDTRSVLIFSSVPLVYYLFDYTVGVYTNLWQVHYRLASEFLAFFLCVVFMVFCVVYYREYERKMLTQRKNQMIEITVRQQAKEIEAIRKSNLETGLIRHDMRLFLSNLALCIEQNDRETALNLISGYASQVEAASVHRYCRNDTVNYVLTNFESKCQKAGVAFCTDLSIGDLTVDEVLFSSILSNGLDNALNAQADIPEGQRQIKLMLKDSDGKLLLSMKNPFCGTSPLDEENRIPVSARAGHGYGTQSILYLTEKLGGKCQFAVQDNVFILRVVL